MKVLEKKNVENSPKAIYVQSFFSEAQRKAMSCGKSEGFQVMHCVLMDAIFFC